MIFSFKETAYQTLDIITQKQGISRKIGNEAIRFPARWFRYYPANYEPQTMQFLREACKPGNTVLDIGSHIGLFSVLMARFVGSNGRVYSFEPTPFTRKVLQETIHLNGYDSIVEVRPEAVSNMTGTTLFYESNTLVNNANSLKRKRINDREIKVTTVTLDNFIESKKIAVDCLKIDVEGAELDLLAGAEKTFKSYKPCVHLSLHPPMLPEGSKNLNEIWNILQDYQMSIYSFQRKVEKDWFVRQDNLFDVCLYPETR